MRELDAIGGFVIRELDSLPVGWAAWFANDGSLIELGHIDEPSPGRARGVGLSSADYAAVMAAVKADEA